MWLLSFKKFPVPVRADKKALNVISWLQCCAIAMPNVTIEGSWVKGIVSYKNMWIYNYLNIIGLI